MPRVTDSTREQGIDRVWLTVKRHPNGVTEREVADFTRIERRTVNNYLNVLRDIGKVGKDGALWFAVDFDATRLRAFELTPEEAYTLYLGSRLLVKQHDKRNEPAETALLKLAEVLTADAGVGQEIAQAARELAQRPVRPEYQPIFTTMVRSYIYRKRVALRYRPLNGRAFETTFATYLLEPSAIGYATYVIGYSSLPDALRAYKLERIEDAQMLSQGYRIPADFPGLEVLRNAWSIMMGDTTVHVELRFSPRVCERVLETQWHPSQTVSDDPERPGHLRWRAAVADTTDMLPWIRGWGADCEVLGPPALRTEIERDARRLGEIYQIMPAEKEFIAHVRKKDKARQSLQDHLDAVAEYTSQFAEKIALKEAGKILGLLHDLGKASDKFQRYIMSGEELIDPDAEEYIDPVAHKGKIDHTTSGAQVVYETLWSKGSKEKVAAQVLALCIASHHSGLIDCLAPDGANNFKRRMEKPEESTRKAEALANLQYIQDSLEGLHSGPVVDQIFAKLTSLHEQTRDTRETLAFKHGLLIRFLLSCLIDADRLDTADFEAPGKALLRNYGQYHPWETVIQRLNNKIAEFERKENKNEVDALRSQVSQACLDFAAKPKGIYQLTVPTGGGKTLASLRFALNHAAHPEHPMDRIIYVIPYTSIIDQNAEEIRKILEDIDEQGHYSDKVVLEHHSNLTPEEGTTRQNLLAENWDAPVIFTTQVQFLEALFGGGTRSVRRMHQLANSVIILDEVQTLPIKVIHMLNVALRFLVNDCGATVVLCTATQPPLDKIDTEYRKLTIDPGQRIIQNEAELFARLKRVEVFDERKVGGWSEEEVAELAARQLQEKGSVLIVVNTKKSARALYHALDTRKPAGAQLHHLSTNMCPAHRLQVLDEIKVKLKNREPVICVSTQLIEAGVDIDFGAVIRYLAGLDSIAQSAGRCNRHGVREGLGNVWVVDPQDESIERLKDIVIGTEQAKRVLDEFKANPASLGHNRIGIEAMAAYYRYYYGQRKEEMKYNVSADSPVGRDDNLFNLLATNTGSVAGYNRVNHASPDLIFSQSFQTVGKIFQVIDSPTRGVIVPYAAEGEQIIAELCSSPELEREFRLLKQAQRYSVNLFAYEFTMLAGIGAIHEVQAGAGVYHLDPQYYSNEFGWNDKPVNDMGLLTT